MEIEACGGSEEGKGHALRFLRREAVARPKELAELCSVLKAAAPCDRLQRQGLFPSAAQHAPREIEPLVADDVRHAAIRLEGAVEMRARYVEMPHDRLRAQHRIGQAGVYIIEDALAHRQCDRHIGRGATGIGDAGDEQDQHSLLDCRRFLRGQLSGDSIDAFQVIDQQPDGCRCAGKHHAVKVAPSDLLVDRCARQHQRQPRTGLRLAGNGPRQIEDHYVARPRLDDIAVAVAPQPPDQKYL